MREEKKHVQNRCYKIQVGFAEAKSIQVHALVCKALSDFLHLYLVWMFSQPRYISSASGNWKTTSVTAGAAMRWGDQPSGTHTQNGSVEQGGGQTGTFCGAGSVGEKKTLNNKKPRLELESGWKLKGLNPNPIDRVGSKLRTGANQRHTRDSEKLRDKNRCGILNHLRNAFF